MLRANGSTLVKPGYIAVYQEGTDDAKTDDDDHVLPAMNEGDTVKLAALHGEQHFTEPPPRFSEASLVKALEEHGIGRPSTYASIISTLRDREYVDIDARRFTATDIGKIVNRFLTKYFTKYVEYGFTADMEDELDAVSRGEEPWTRRWRSSGSPSSTRSGKSRPTSAARKSRCRATSACIRNPAGRCRCAWAASGPSCRPAPRTMKRSRSSRACVPGRRWTPSRWSDALVLFQLPRKLGETADGEPIITVVGRFGPYVKYGAKYVSLKEDDPYTVDAASARSRSSSPRRSPTPTASSRTSASTTSRC